MSVMAGALPPALAGTGDFHHWPRRARRRTLAGQLAAAQQATAGDEAMPLTMRPYANENDFWRVRDFLREVSVVFEPVGTHPAHQKRGLGKAVMT